MSSKLDFTGERFVPECEREIWYEHMHRYAFAARQCGGARVLDAACGEGYGAALLAASATSVVGLDLSEAAIGHARARYGDRPGLSFQVGDCTRLPFEDDSFERITSFETLEHLEAQDRMLAEFARVLRPGGLLMLSSPDKAVYTDQAGNRNPYHVRELYRDELESLLARHFPHVQLWGQKLQFHSTIWRPAGGDGVVRQRMEPETMRLYEQADEDAMYFIALCAGEPDSLPDAQAALWLFDDARASVYEHYQGEIRRNMAAGGIIAEKDREIAELRARLEGRPASRRKPWRRWFKRG